jgi:deoxyadenosine/deoxycytidine kinase
VEHQINSKVPTRAEVVDEVVNDMLAPHPHANEELWKHALPEYKEVYDRMVEEGKRNAEASIQAALGLVVNGDWPTLDDCIPEGSLTQYRKNQIF